MKFSDEQLSAIQTKYNKVIIAAGSGAGKTATIIGRINYLIDNGVDPSKIYAITFTNMAAQEMLERITEKGKDVFIGTIHSLANKILMTNGISTQQAIENEDFDKFFELLEENLEILKIPEVEHLIVDEFQDVCDNEYTFMKDILKPKNFLVCGDSQQSIFGFKGGNYHLFMNMVEDPFTQVYELKDNYRSCPEILQFAKTQLKGVHGIYRIVSHPMREDEGDVSIQEFSYARLLSEIESVGEYKDWFVLARTNAEIDSVMTFLHSNDIPCVTFKKSEKSYEDLKNDLNKNAVKVLTIHSAKGLESPCVAVIGAKNWNDEEKRISYVAATRAKDYLVWFNYQKKRGARAKAKMYDDYADIDMTDWG